MSPRTSRRPCGNVRASCLLLIYAASLLDAVAAFASEGSPRRPAFAASSLGPRLLSRSRLPSAASDLPSASDPREQLLDSLSLSLSNGLPPVRSVNPHASIFCNRETNMSGVGAIGFDMDYTLAQYVCPAFDELAFDGALGKLVGTLGYPAEVLDFSYDHTQWRRGLIIDTQRGNFLKIDRHKYVRVAYHGINKMSSATRKALYAKAFNKVPSFSEKSFVNVDTLFQLVDAHLFALLVELKDSGEHEFMDAKTYTEMFKDARYAIDLCHRDGVIKDEVAKNPGRYIVPDPDMVQMLQGFKEAGTKVFLLTNSFWEYTDVVMNFLYHGKHVDQTTKSKREWLSLFDLVIVGSCKPAFLVDPKRSLFRVDPATGTLTNTDGVFEIDALGPGGARKFLDAGKIFQGGQWEQLQAMLETTAGDEILYVGDHLFSDVLRSKRTLGWRTALIVPELVDEVVTYAENFEEQDAINRLRTLREEINVHKEALRRKLRKAEESERGKIARALTDAEHDYSAVKVTVAALADKNHSKYHSVWGQLFRAGYQDSRFAFYVQNYACLYTSKATNMAAATEFRSFHPVGERLPHDQLLDSGAVYEIDDV